MSPKKIKRLNHLAQIIQKLPIKDSRWIFTDMEADIQFDKLALEYLAKKSFNPSELLEVLSRDELKLIFKNLPDDILKSFFNDNLSKKELIEAIIGKKKYTEIIDSGDEANAEIYPEAIRKILFDKIGEGKITYNGVNLYLQPVKCRTTDEIMHSRNLAFQIFNPLVSPEEGIKFYIYDPTRSGDSIRLSLQTTGKRFFNKDNWFITLNLDNNGFYFGEIFPDRTLGPATIWLEVVGSGEVCKTIYFTGAKSTFSLSIKKINALDTSLEIDSEFLNKENIQKHKFIRTILYCSRCGNPLGSGKFQISDNEVKMKFPMNEERYDHKHDYYLHSFYGESQSITRLNAFSSLENFPFNEEMKNRKPGDMIKISLPLEIGESIFFHISTRIETDRAARLSIASGNLKYSKGASNNFNRKASSIETAHLNGDIHFLSDYLDSLKSGLIQNYNPEVGFEYHPVKWENISDLFITFYRLSSTGLFHIYSVISKVVDESFIYPYLPNFLNPDEFLEIELGYNSKETGKINISSNPPIDKNVRGRGILQFPIQHNQQIDISLISKNITISQKINLPERSLKIITISHIPKSTTIKNNGTIYSLFNSVNSISDYISENYLLNYPWGCGEQTAAKIAGLCLLLVNNKSLNENNPLIKRVNNGLTALSKFKSESGHYKIFPQGSADITNSILIYNNLKLILPHRNILNKLIPELWKVIDDLNALISNDSDNTQELEKKTGRAENPNSIAMNIYDEKSIFETFSKTVTLKDNKLVNYKGLNYQSIATKSFTALQILLDKGINTIDVFGSKNSKTREYDSEGFRGVIEKIGLVDRPKKTLISTKTKTLSPAISYLLPATEISFLEGSYPSTVDIVSLLGFLYSIHDLIDKYEYSSDNPIPQIDKTFSPIEDTTVKSDYTFALSSYPISENPPSKSSIPVYSISQKKLLIGETLRIKIKRRLVSDIYTIFIPGILEPTYTSEFHIESPDRVKISPFYINDEIVLKAIRKGKGKLSLLVEDMYETSKIFILDLDWIEVE